MGERKSDVPGRDGQNSMDSMGTQEMAKRVVVIGAGWAGIAAAKTYLQISPSIHLTILDSSDSFGGVWSKSRLYPGLYVDSPRSLYEFSDMSMVDPSHDPPRPKWGDVPGEEVHGYMCKYAERFGLRERTRFGVVVKRVERLGKGWKVMTEGGETWECDKLLVATGKYSVPFVPNVPVDERFKGPVLHTKELGQKYHLLTSDDKIKDVVIVGSSKSGIEAANIVLDGGKRVQYISRRAGNGPSVIVLKPRGEKVNSLAVSRTKMFVQLCPSIYNREGWWYWFLHSGKVTLGYELTKRFWSGVQPPHPDWKANEKMEKIKHEMADESFFWITRTVSYVSKEAAFLKAMMESEKEERVMVYQESPISVEVKEQEDENGVKVEKSFMRLATGEEIPCDAVVWATGWSPTFTPIFSTEQALELGLPIPLDQEPPEVEKYWAQLDSEADTEVLRMFPFLANPPKYFKRTPQVTQHRLFRHMISPKLMAEEDRSIAFLGICGSAHTVTFAELQALWAVAWMEDLFPKLSPSLSKSEQPERYDQERLEKDVALVNAFQDRRYLSRGRLEPEFVMEIQTVFDTLMADLGLEVQRKRMYKKGLLGGWISEFFVPYENKEYQGVIEELLDRRREIEAKVAKVSPVRQE